LENEDGNKGFSLAKLGSIYLYPNYSASRDIMTVSLRLAHTKVAIRQCLKNKAMKKNRTVK
jgi:hypothetical protein